MANVSFVFFDYGGTLSKISKDTPQIVLDVLQEQGYDIAFEQVAKAYHVSEAWLNENQGRLPRGQRKLLLEESNAVLFRSLDVPNPEKLAKKVQAEWHVRAGFGLFPDSIPCLEELRRHRIPMGIITQNWDTDEEFRSHALRISGIGHYFSVIATSESIGYDKPDPRLFLRAATETGFPPDSILYVGDKLDLDIGGARMAGLQAILIDRKGTAKQSEVRTISSLSELPQLLF